MVRDGSAMRTRALLVASAVLLVVQVLAGGSSTAPAEPAPSSARVAPVEDFWSVNGEVEALAVSGVVLYVGGDFSRISPNTGPLAAFSRGSAQLEAFPRIVEGTVDAIVEDGRGGWFVGGEFAAIAGVHCQNLAHVTARRRVDRRWCPRPQGKVVALARHGSTLFVGGVLRRIGGKPRRTLAALNTTTGRALEWNPDPGYFVDDVEVHGRTVYVLGSFGEVGGKPHGALAAIDAVTGRVHDWDPDPPIDEHGDPLLRRLAVSDSVVYAGGAILVAFDRRTGMRTRWSPSPDGYVSAMSIAGGRLVVGGSFGRIARARRSNLASFSVDAGSLDRWSPKSEPVSALSLDGSVVRVAGERDVGAFEGRTGRKLPWSTGAPNAVVRALSSSPAGILAGGVFDGVGGVERNGLAAIDLRTGKPTAWDPRLGGGSPRNAVYTIATNGSTVFVGGLFKTVRGVRRNVLAAVDARAGRPTSFEPEITGYSVNALALNRSTLYVGGDFEAAARSPRTGNAAFDISSGALLGWYPKVGYLPIVVRDSTVYLGRRSVAAVDAKTGAHVKWEIGLEVFRVPSVDALAVADGVVYFGGFFEKAGGRDREGLAAADASSGALRDWNPGRNHTDFVHALTVDRGVVYVGSFAGLRAVDAKSGSVVRSYSALADERVDALVVRDGRVYAGTEHGLVVLQAARR
jgi:hypothetical protein